MAAYDKPLPDVTDPAMAPFWEGTKKHELSVRKCKKCGEYQWPPRVWCSNCHSFDFDWVKVSGKGNLHTYTVVSRAFHPAFLEVPYGVAIVRLDEGVQMIGKAVGIKPEDLKIGMPMKAAFSDVTEEVTLVNWKPI